MSCLLRMRESNEQVRCWVMKAPCLDRNVGFVFKIKSHSSGATFGKNKNRHMRERFYYQQRKEDTFGNLDLLLGKKELGFEEHLCDRMSRY